MNVDFPSIQSGYPDHLDYLDLARPIPQVRPRASSAQPPSLDVEALCADVKQMSLTHKNYLREVFEDFEQTKTHLILITKNSPPQKRKKHFQEIGEWLGPRLDENRCQQHFATVVKALTSLCHPKANPSFQRESLLRDFFEPFSSFHLTWLVPMLSPRDLFGLLIPSPEVNAICSRHFDDCDNLAKETSYLAQSPSEIPKDWPFDRLLSKRSEFAKLSAKLHQFKTESPATNFQLLFYLDAHKEYQAELFKSEFRDSARTKAIASVTSLTNSMCKQLPALQEKLAALISRADFMIAERLSKMNPGEMSLPELVRACDMLYETEPLDREIAMIGRNLLESNLEASEKVRYLRTLIERFDDIFPEYAQDLLRDLTPEHFSIAVRSLPSKHLPEYLSDMAWTDSGLTITEQDSENYALASLDYRRMSVEQRQALAQWVLTAQTQLGRPIPARYWEKLFDSFRAKELQDFLISVSRVEQKGFLELSLLNVEEITRLFQEKKEAIANSRSLSPLRETHMTSLVMTQANRYHRVFDAHDTFYRSPFFSVEEKTQQDIQAALKDTPIQFLHDKINTLAPIRKAAEELISFQHLRRMPS